MDIIKFETDCQLKNQGVAHNQLPGLTYRTIGVTYLRAARRVLSSISSRINMPFEIPCNPKK
jgi:hypothetical protein